MWRIHLSPPAAPVPPWLRTVSDPGSRPGFGRGVRRMFPIPEPVNCPPTARRPVDPSGVHCNPGGPGGIGPEGQGTGGCISARPAQPVAAASRVASGSRICRTRSARARERTPVARVAQPDPSAPLPAGFRVPPPPELPSGQAGDILAGTPAPFPCAVVCTRIPTHPRVAVRVPPTPQTPGQALVQTGPPLGSRLAARRLQPAWAREHGGLECLPVPIEADKGPVVWRCGPPR
jgi:hypothetical protein